MTRKRHEIFKISSVIFFLAVLISCTKKEEVENTIDLNNLNLELEIDFSKGKFDLSQDIMLLTSEMTDLIYSKDNNIKSFSIEKSNNQLLINYPQKETTRGGEYIAAPCDTQKKTCRNKKCVEDTLKKILGKGDRDVIIKYSRNTFSVTIEYTYQDC